MYAASASALDVKLDEGVNPCEFLLSLTFQSTFSMDICTKMVLSRAKLVASTKYTSVQSFTLAWAFSCLWKNVGFNQNQKSKESYTDFSASQKDIQYQKKIFSNS